MDFLSICQSSSKDSDSRMLLKMPFRTETLQFYLPLGLGHSILLSYMSPNNNECLIGDKRNKTSIGNLEYGRPSLNGSCFFRLLEDHMKSLGASIVIWDPSASRTI